MDSRSYERVSGRVAEHSHAAGERRGIEPQAGILMRQFSRFARPKMYITPSMAMRLSSISSTIGNRPCFVPDQEIGQLALVHLSLIVPKPHCPCGSPGPCSIVRVVTPNQLAICPDFAEPFQNLQIISKSASPHTNRKCRFEQDEAVRRVAAVNPPSIRGLHDTSCHGSLNGQKGFKLSLFGYDPDADYKAVVVAKIP